MGDVKIYDVKNADIPVVDAEGVPSVTAVVVAAPKRGAYQRLRFALRLLGIGHFEFERERDDRP